MSAPASAAAPAAASASSSAAAPMPSPSPPPRRHRGALWRSGVPGRSFISPLPPHPPVQPIPLCASDDPVQLRYLAHMPELVSQVAAALWAEWGAEDFSPCDGMHSAEDVAEWLRADCCHTTQLGCTIVALVDGVLIACAMLCPEDTPPEHPYFGTVPWASYNVVLPAHRGRGYSALTWRRLTLLAKEWGYAHCWCVSETQNVALYEKFGYRAIEILPFWGVLETVMRADFPQKPQLEQPPQLLSAQASQQPAV